MKKIYQNPTTKVVKIQTVKMIAASPDGFNSTLNTDGGDGSNALGRRSNSIWDDDEEDYDE